MLRELGLPTHSHSSLQDTSKLSLVAAGLMHIVLAVSVPECSLMWYISGLIHWEILLMRQGLPQLQTTALETERDH